MGIRIKQKIKTAAARAYFSLAYFTLPREWRKVYKWNQISSKEIVAYTQKRCIPITRYMKWLRRDGFRAELPNNHFHWFDIATKQLETNEGGLQANHRRKKAQRLLDDWKKMQEKWRS